MPVIHTIGYGGRTPTSLIQSLQDHGIGTVADVRLRPDSAYMNYYKLTRNPDTGIAPLFARAGLGYVSFLELGNLFNSLGESAWQSPYEQLLEASGALLTARLRQQQGHTCLMCSEKDPHECHRTLIADYLTKYHEYEVVHIE